LEYDEDSHISIFNSYNLTANFNSTLSSTSIASIDSNNREDVSASSTDSQIDRRSMVVTTTASSPPRRRRNLLKQILSKLGKYPAIEVKKRIADYAGIYYGEKLQTANLCTEKILSDISNRQCF
jgi:hypothetical protein